VSPGAAAALDAWLELLASWSLHANLTGARSPEARVRILVAPVVPVAPTVKAGLLLDVGAGSGSPGLALAVLRPDLPATLLEPRARRWAFLLEAARTVGRPEIEVRRQRHLDYDGPPGQTLTLRALRVPGPELAPLVVPGGSVLVFGVALREPRPLVPEPPGAFPPGLHAYRRPSCST
jgi:16S rRNA (guanine527-N7)-methyltransferase